MFFFADLEIRNRLMQKWKSSNFILVAVHSAAACIRMDSSDLFDKFVLHYEKKLTKNIRPTDI